MTFDIIDISEEELEKLSVAKMKLLRDAQQKKDGVIRKAEEEFEKFRLKILSAGMKYSSLLNDKKAELDREVERECATIADNLEYAMSVADKAKDEPDYSGVGYLVDFSLSYSDRWAIVRDYYLAIPDREERMKLYAADEVAKKYLDSYYVSLYNLLATYDK